MKKLIVAGILALSVVANAKYEEMYGIKVDKVYDYMYEYSTNDHNKVYFIFNDNKETMDFRWDSVLNNLSSRYNKIDVVTHLDTIFIGYGIHKCCDKKALLIFHKIRNNIRLIEITNRKEGDKIINYLKANSENQADNIELSFYNAIL